MNDLELRERAIRFLVEHGIAEYGAIGRTTSSPFPSAATQGTVIVGLASSDLGRRLPEKHFVETFYQMLHRFDERHYAWDNVEQISVWVTARALRGMLMISPGQAKDPRVRGALHWLVTQQNGDGGFGLKAKLPSRPVYTHYAAMALAEVLRTPDSTDQERVAVRALLDCGNYLIRARNHRSFRWRDGIGDDECPVSTLLAVNTLDTIRDATRGTGFETDVTKQRVRDWVAGAIIEANRGFWEFSERPYVNWVFEEFLPGRVDLLLALFDTDHAVFNWAISYLRNSWVREGDSVGWTYDNLREPVTWVTALGVQSLSLYSAKRAEAPLRMMPKKAEGAMVDRRSVFVVHGRDGACRDAMFAFLRALDLKPIEWSRAVEMTGKPTPYIGEVLDAAFSAAQAIIVLLTPDDEARLRKDLVKADDPSFEKTFSGQARPNVLFEAGMAMGRNADRTILVEAGELRPFSDVGGRHVVRFRGSAADRQSLVARLHSAGCEVDGKGTDWLSAGDFSACAR